MMGYNIILVSGTHIGVATLNRPIDNESKTKCFIIDNLYYIVIYDIIVLRVATYRSNLN